MRKPMPQQIAPLFRCGRENDMWHCGALTDEAIGSLGRPGELLTTPARSSLRRAPTLYLGSAELHR